MGLIELATDIAVPEAAVPLQLLGKLRGTGNWLCAHPMVAIAVFASAFGIFEHHEAAKWGSLARQRGAAITAIQSTNAQAIQQATQAKEIKDASNAKLAADSDKAAADLRTRYRAAIVQLAAAQNHNRAANLPVDADTAPGGNGPGVSSSLSGDDLPTTPDPASLAISQEDAVTCADNTARLQAVQQWAVGLSK